MQCRVSEDSTLDMGKMDLHIWGAWVDQMDSAQIDLMTCCWDCVDESYLVHALLLTLLYIVYMQPP